MSEPKIAAMPLALTGLAPLLTVAPSAEYLAKKADLLESASLVFAVDGEDDEKAAMAVASQIKALEREVETGRETVKKPIVIIGREIDAKAKEFVLELARERTRIESLLGSYLAEKRRVLEAAQEVERKALAKAAEEEAERQREVEALADALGVDAPEPPPALPVPVVALATPKPTVSGGTMRAGWDYEVSDIRKFYEAFPLFVKMEVVRSSLIAYLNGACPNPEAVPGIRAFRKEKFSARAAVPPPTIEQSPFD